MSGAETTRVVVPGSLAGERVDRAVALLSGRPRSEAAELVAAGAVRVGGDRVARSRRLAEGELVELDLPEPAEAAEGLVPDPSVPFRVVHEDPEIVVVDKPAGVVVHPGAGHRDGTLASGLLARYPELGELAAAGAWPEDRPGLVHRLDKDTSGLLVVARTARSYGSLRAQLAGREMGRSYLALALGHLQAGEGTIDAPLGRSGRSPTRIAVRADGREARTHYRVIDRMEGDPGTTLLELRLETGRTHQIRVHLSAIGHPVAGDRRYGGSAPALGLLRPFLHAAHLRLRHPETDEELQLVSPLPADLAEVLERLRSKR